MAASGTIEIDEDVKVENECTPSQVIKPATSTGNINYTSPISWDCNQRLSAMEVIVYLHIYEWNWIFVMYSVSRQIMLHQTLIMINEMSISTLRKPLSRPATLYLLGCQIRKAHRQQIIAGCKNMPAKWRLISLEDMNISINELYFKSIMNCKNNTRIIRNVLYVQDRLFSFCGNKKCKKNYIEYKYGQKKKDIMILILNGKKLKAINKWYKCKRCVLQCYCSHYCQKYHWKYAHRYICRK